MSRGASSPRGSKRVVAALIIGNPYPERTAITLDNARMSRYVGHYAGDDAPPVEISIVDGGLRMDFGEFASFDLQAEDPNTFFVDDSLMYVDVQWADDAVASLEVYFSEGEPPTVLKPVRE